jgi:hypothetical protein
MFHRKHFVFLAAAMFVAALLAAGCASTTLQSIWIDPGFTGGPFKKFFVVGLSARDVTTRRVFEDIVVARIQAAGAQAVPAWQAFPDEGRGNEPAMEAAVAQSGADALLMTRLLGIDTRTNVSTVMVPGPVWGPGMGPGFGPGPGWWGPYQSWQAVPQVTQYQIATAETTLFDVKTHRVVWSATSQTFNPTSVQQEAPGLADQVIGALQSRGLIGAK